MVEMNAIVVAWVNFMGGSDIILSLLSIPFMYTIGMLFWRISI